jgi:hypothetical protein
LPRMGSFGGASWNAFRSKGLVATPVPGTFGAATRTGAGNIVVSWATATIGDMALVAVTTAGGTVPAAPAGWSKIASTVWGTYGYGWGIYSKVLAAGDIAGGATFVLAGDGSLIFGSYHGGGSVQAVGGLTGGQTSAGAGSNVLPGFAKSGTDRLIVCVVMDRDRTNSDTFPAGWSLDLASVNLGAGFYTGAFGSLPPAQYANNATVTVTNGPGNLGTEAQLLVIGP